MKHLFILTILVCYLFSGIDATYTIINGEIVSTPQEEHAFTYGVDTSFKTKKIIKETLKKTQQKIEQTNSINSNKIALLTNLTKKLIPKPTIKYQEKMADNFKHLFTKKETIEKEEINKEHYSKKLKSTSINSAKIAIQANQTKKLIPKPSIKYQEKTTDDFKHLFKEKETLEEYIEPKQNVNLDLGTSITLFNATSNELVYLTGGGQRISELIWEAKNIPLLGLSMSYEPMKSYKLYANYKKNIKTSDGQMDDYDYILLNYPDIWTHWSTHPNTKVKDISIIDVGIKKDFEFKEIQTKLSAQLGYKLEKQSFDAYDGSYIYSVNGFRDASGDVSGLGISYNQEYKGFYIGAQAQYDINNLSLGLGMKYTPFMDIKWSDRHYLRVPAFIDTTSFKKTDMMNTSIMLQYTFLTNHAIKLLYEYTKYSLVKGDRIRSYDDGTSLSLPKSVGIKSSNNILSLEYLYSF